MQKKSKTKKPAVKLAKTKKTSVKTVKTKSTLGKKPKAKQSTLLQKLVKPQKNKVMPVKKVKDQTSKVKENYVGKAYKANTKYIDPDEKRQRDFVVLKQDGKKVTVAKVKGIKKIDEQGRNADKALYEIDYQKYGLKKPSGIDFQRFSKKYGTKEALRLSDGQVFPTKVPSFQLSSKDKHNVLIHTGIINDPKKQKKK